MSYGLDISTKFLKSLLSSNHANGSIIHIFGKVRLNLRHIFIGLSQERPLRSKVTEGVGEKFMSNLSIDSRWAGGGGAGGMMSI